MKTKLNKPTETEVARFVENRLPEIRTVIEERRCPPRAIVPVWTQRHGVDGTVEVLPKRFGETRCFNRGKPFLRRYLV